MTNQLPTYTKKEERINSLSHGFGALLSLITFIFLLLKSNSQKEYITCTIFGLSMFNLYLISCLYHAKSPKKKSKKILRLIDHCNVYLLVFGTYIPISLLSIPSQKAIYLVILVGFITLIGIILSCLNLNRYQTLEVICHLFNGWSILIGFPELHQTLKLPGLFLLIGGGILYSIGAFLYQIGSRKKYMHSIFHFFCIMGSFAHFFCIYLYLL